MNTIPLPRDTALPQTPIALSTPTRPVLPHPIPPLSTVETGAAAEFMVLIISHSPSLGRLLTDCLSTDALSCRYAPDVDAASVGTHRHHPHLILLESSHPARQGHDCSALRRRTRAPIIVLTSLGSDDQHLLQGFKAGADDYILQPFSTRLLRARVTTLLRRTYHYDKAALPKNPSLADSVSDSEQPPSLPSGWTSCNGCHYIGPTHKFTRHVSQQQTALTCPNCGEHHALEFGL